MCIKKVTALVCQRIAVHSITTTDCLIAGGRNRWIGVLDRNKWVLNGGENGSKGRHLPRIEDRDGLVGVLNDPVVHSRGSG